MSVEQQLWMLVLGLGLGIAAVAEEEPAPEAEFSEFIEYLGMWELSDEEWLLLADEEPAVAEERSEPAPKGEDSTEKEDES